MSQPPFEPARAHRWFAVESNNLAWALVESDPAARSADDTERMIHAAHASVYHWLQVGDLLNHQRGQCLLATAYAAAGLAEPAVRHAERCLSLSAEAGDRQTAFDRATAHGCASRAYALAGRMEEARREYGKARAAVAVFDDPDDVVVFEKLYPNS